MKKNWNQIFEDEHLLVINKPAGLLSIPDRFFPDKPNLFSALNQVYGKVWVVHRLDKETSGVICFAKTQEAHRDLSQQFESRKVEKYYHALVEGRLISDKGQIDKPIAASKSKGGKMIISAHGKPALTSYQVLEHFKAYTLVKVKIETGRTHQIRVHFPAIGHPLAVDATYGNKEAFYLSQVKFKSYRLGKNQSERPLMHRTSLHAHQLIITHPQSKKNCAFEATLPKDFKAVLNQLRKWGK